MSNAQHSSRRAKRRRARAAKRAAKQAAMEKRVVRRLVLYTMAGVLILGGLIFLVFPSLGVVGAGGIASFVIFAVSAATSSWVSQPNPRAPYRALVMAISGVLLLAFVLRFPS
ncbi:hypothetical protein [Microtetraspora malaysiensis]|uniref:hypothetical protein n=1 Tax=Microtetraspora malaysiensis TaxID=161358 RepID=UPI003D91C586